MPKRSPITMRSRKTKVSEYFISPPPKSVRTRNVKGHSEAAKKCIIYGCVICKVKK